MLQGNAAVAAQRPIRADHTTIAPSLDGRFADLQRLRNLFRTETAFQTARSSLNHLNDRQPALLDQFVQTDPNRSPRTKSFTVRIGRSA